MPEVEKSDQIVTKETISKEPVQELESRIRLEAIKMEYDLREKQDTAQHQRFLEKVKVFAFLTCALVAIGVCLYVSFSSGFQQEEKKQAASTVQQIVMGIVGFMAGKATSNKANPP